MTAGGAGCSPATSSRRTGSTRTRWRCSTCCRCRTGSSASTALQLHAAGNVEQPALEQPAAARQPPVGRQQRLGRRCARSTRTSTDRRSPPARRSGASSTASYISGDNSVNGGWNHIFGSTGVNEFQTGVPPRRPKGSDQERRRSGPHPQERRRLHPAASSSGAEHARRDPDARPSAWRRPASTARTSPTTAASASTAYDYARRACATTSRWTRGTPHVQGRRLLRVHARTTRRAAATGWGSSSSATTPTIRSTRTSRFRTRCSASSSSTPRPTATARRTTGSGWSEWYAQDTWQRDAALHARLRRALPAATRRTGGRTSRSRTSIRRRYDPAQRAAALSAGARQRRRASRSIRSPGQTLNQIYIGAYVPGTGDPNERHGAADRRRRAARVPRDAGAADRAARRLQLGSDRRRARRSCTRAPGCSTTRGSAAASCGNLRNPPFIHNPIVFLQHDGDDVRAGRDAGEPPGQRSRRSRRTTRRRARTTGRSACAASIGWGTVDGRDLRRQRRPQPGDVLRPQRGAGRRAVPRSASRRTRDPDSTSADGRAAGRVPAAVLAATRTSASRGNSGNVRLPLAAGAGEPPLHPRRAVRRRLHAAARARPGRRGSRQPLDHAQPPAGLFLLRSSRRATGTSLVDQLHVGHLAATAFQRGAAPRCSTAGSSRARTRSSAATGRRSS